MPEDVLTTPELAFRVARSTDYEAEVAAYRRTTEYLRKPGAHPLQVLANEALSLAPNGSAGVIVTAGPLEKGIFHFMARRGHLTPLMESLPPISFSGHALAALGSSPHLFAGPAPFLREFTQSENIEETLVLPFLVSGQRRALVWVASHSPTTHIDSEHVRLLKSLASFVSSFVEKTEQNEVAVLQDKPRSRENKLRIAHEQLGLALANGGMAAWHFDFLSGELTSEGMEAIYGEPLKGTTKEIMKRYLFPEDFNEVLRGWREALRQKRDHVSEHRVRHAAGGERWVLVRGSATFSPEGKPLTMSGVIADITEKKLSQARLQSAYDQLASIFAQAPVPIAIFEGPNHRFLLANNPYETMVARKVIGLTISDVFSRDGMEDFGNCLDQVLRTGEPYVENEIRFGFTNPKGNSQNRYLNVSYQPFRNAHGEIAGIIAVHADVTEDVQARRRAEVQEERIREVANTMPQIVWTARSDGHVDWSNDQWRLLAGSQSNRDWNGCTTLHPDDVARTKSLWLHSISSGNPFEAKYRFRDERTGTFRWHLGRALPLRSNTGEILRWIGTDTDVHEQMLLLQQLEEERRLRERFVAALSHDLRTPLTAAKLSAQLVGRAGTAHRGKELADRVVENINRVDRMIRDLLDVGRISDGETIPAKPEACDLKEVLTKTVQSLVEIHGTAVTFECSLDKVFGLWDGPALERVIENLVNNAAKYGRPRGPIAVLLRPGNEVVEISVHNEGNPISPEQQKRLFDYYRRTDLAEQGGHVGWGIGLTLVKNIAQAHGGTVLVESSAEQGTRFLIRLPWISRALDAKCS